MLLRTDSIISAALKPKVCCMSPVVTSSVLCSLAFSFDLMMPIGVASGVAYVPFIFSSRCFDSPKWSFHFAVIATLLAIFDCMVRTPPGLMGWMVVTNRAIQISVFWIIAAITFLSHLKFLLTAQAEEKSALLASIVESSEDAIIGKTLDGIVRTWNRGAENLFGYKESEVIGKHISILIPEDLKSEEDYIIGQIREGKSVAHYETTRCHKDRHEIIISLTISPIRDKTGRIIGASKIARDITRDRELKAKLKKSEQRYQLAFEGMSVGVWDWDVATGSLYWSARFRDIIGVGHTTLVPHYSDFATRLHPDDKERTEAMLFGHVRGECPYDIEYRLRRENGEYAWIHATGQAAWDADGQPLRMVGSVDDITQRKLNEERLALLAPIVESSDDAIIAKDLDGIIYTWNQGAERLFGYSAEEVLGKHINLLIPPLLRSRENQILAEIRQGRQGMQFETARLNKSGREISVSLTVSPILNQDGQVIGASKIARDITARKEIEAALRASEMRFELALAGMSVGLWDWDVTSGVNYWSPRLKEMLGLPQDFAPTYNAFEAILHPDDLEPTRAALQAHFRREAAYEIEYRLRRTDGVYLWIYAKGQACWDDNGYPLRMAGSCDNITSLKLAEEKFRLVVECAPNGIIMIDTTGNIVLSNRQTESLFGFTQDELLGQKLEILLPERYRARHVEHRALFFKELDTTRLQDRSMRGAELYGLHKDGREFPLEVGLIPLQMGEGHFALGSVADITRRREAEEKERKFKEMLELQVGERTRDLEAAKDKLHKTGEQLELILEHIGEGIFGIDAEGSTIFVNNAAVSILGDRVEALIAETRQSLACQLTGGSSPCFKEDAAPSQTHMTLEARSGETALFVNGNGTFVTIEHTTSPIFDKQGTVKGSVVVFRDITERKKVERYNMLLQNIALSANDAHSLNDVLTTTLRHICQMLDWPLGHAYWWDEKKQMLVPSRCWYVAPGKESDFHEFIETSGHMVFSAGAGLPGTVFELAVPLWIEDLASDPLFLRLHVLKAAGLKSGLGVPVRMNKNIKVILEFFDDGIVQKDNSLLQMLHNLGMELISRVFERKQAEAELEDYAKALALSNQELDEFAFAASHDLKAPLRVIDNASKWLEEDLREHLTGDMLETMSLLRGRVKRMEKLLDDLLEYSRIGRKVNGGSAELIMADVMMDNILMLLSPPPGFTVEISPAFAGIIVPRMPLQQILMNLISNAIKHHDKKTGLIEVSIEDRGGSFDFTVRDDGPGISPQFHTKIFKMFQTLKPRDQVEGSGMGLAMARKHIELAGGTIVVDSAEGKGSIFHFTWPKTHVIH